MSYFMYPEGVLGVKIDKVSVQSYLFGHRIRPQQTCYEYLSEATPHISRKIITPK